MIEVTRVNLSVSHYLDPSLDWLPEDFLREVAKASSPVYLFEHLPAFTGTRNASSRGVCLLVSLRFRPTFVSALDITSLNFVYFQSRIIDCLRAIASTSDLADFLGHQIYSWLSPANSKFMSLTDFSIQKWEKQAAMPSSDINALALNHSMLALATSGDASGTSEGIVFSPAQINVAESKSQVLMVAGLHGSGKTTLAEHRFATTLAQGRSFGSAVFCSPRHQYMSVGQEDRFQEVLNRFGLTYEFNPELFFFSTNGVSAYWLLAKHIYTIVCKLFSGYMNESLPYADITSLDSLCSLALETVELLTKKEPLFCLSKLIVIDDAIDMPHCLIDLCKAVSLQTVLFVNPLLEKAPAWPPCGYPGMSYIMLDHSYTLTGSDLQVPLVQAALRRWNKLGVLDTPPPLDFFGFKLRLPSQEQLRKHDFSVEDEPVPNALPFVAWMSTYPQIQAIYNEVLEGRKPDTFPLSDYGAPETLIVLLNDVSEDYSLSLSSVPDALLDFYPPYWEHEETDQAYVCGTLQARLLRQSYKRIFLLSKALLETPGWERTFLYVASHVSESIYMVAPDLGLV
jgi:hypothetical protein